MFLTASCLYQLFRFAALVIPFLVFVQVAAPPDLSGLALAIAATGVVPAVMLLQLILTRSEALLAPLRVGLTLQMLGSLLFLLGIPGADAGLLLRPVALLTAAGLVFLLDAVSLLYLLSYRPKVSPTHLDPRPPASAGPDINVEELEEQ